MDTQTKREQEKQLVSQMIALYCKHHGGKRLCPQCAALDQVCPAAQ
ncbi:MAG: nitrous oxide-stimulated promoter family protein [Oscillospiraceae bacterium]